MDPSQTFFNMNLHTLALIAMLTATAGFMSGYNASDQTSIQSSYDSTCDDPCPNDTIRTMNEAVQSCDEDSPGYRNLELFLQPFDTYVYRPWYEVGEVYRQQTT